MHAAARLLHRLEFLVELHGHDADDQHRQGHDDEGQQDNGRAGGQGEGRVHQRQRHEDHHEDRHGADDLRDDGARVDEQALAEVGEGQQDRQVEQHTGYYVLGGTLHIRVGARLIAPGVPRGGYGGV